MGNKAWKNSLISDDKYLDLAGNLVYHANHGQRSLGTDFETGEQLGDLDELISSEVFCNLCGKPFKNKKEIVKTVGKKTYCKDCLDGVHPRGK